MSKFYTKISLSLLLLVFIFNTGRAQNYQWAKGLGGASSESGYAIGFDAAGNVYTAGAYQGTFDFDPGTGITSLISSGSFDVFITKFDPTGKLLWAKSVGGILDDRAYGIAINSANEVFVTGYFKGTVDFDPSSATSELTSAGADDIFILKLSTAGDFVWVKQMGGPDVDRPKSICLDGSGNILTTGYFVGTADFDPAPTTNSLTSAASTSDIFVSKLNASGNYVWARKFGVASLDEGHAITSDASGNVYVTGEYGGNVDFDPSSGTAELVCAGVYDIFVLKLNSSGDLVWAKSLGGDSYDSGNGIAVDATGNVYTTGLFGDDADFDPASTIFTLTAAGGVIDQDIFVSKLNAAGSFAWAKRLGATSDDLAYAIALDNQNNVYTTGTFHDVVDFDPGSGVMNLTSVFGTEIFISKLNSDGTFVWAKQAGGTLSDNAYSIKVDGPAYNIYVTGDFQGTGADFDPGTGVSGLTSAGASDIFILKLSMFSLGINDNLSSTVMNAYPNPSSGLVTIHLNEVLSNASLSLVDLLGNEVDHVDGINSSELQLDLRNLNSGVYFVRLQNGTSLKTLKIVKE